MDFIWESLARGLMDNAEHNKHGFWSDGNDILCKTEGQAEALADFLEDVGFDYVKTGYYDPEEDKRNNEVDKYTGYWYVDVD